MSKETKKPLTVQDKANALRCLGDKLIYVTNDPDPDAMEEQTKSFNCPECDRQKFCERVVKKFIVNVIAAEDCPYKTGCHKLGYLAGKNTLYIKEVCLTVKYLGCHRFQGIYLTS
jgi:hypothetical protein